MKRLISKFGKMIVGGCVIVTGFDVIGHPASVVGSSMYPTLHGEDASWWNRDFVWISCWKLYNCSPDTVLIYTSPRQPDKVHIKRVRAVEGSAVKPENRNELMVIPKGHYWMEGDNPQNRNDSNVYGPVSKGLVRGRATHVIWPPSRWQKLS